MIVNIITRDMWHALRHRTQTRVERCSHVYWMNVKFQECSHRLECTAILNNHQRYQINKQGLRDLRYNFVIGGDGNVYEARGWDIQPLLPHDSYHMCDKSFVIGFLGLYQKSTLPEVMRKTAEALVEYGVSNKHIERGYELHDLLVILPKQPSA